VAAHDNSSFFFLAFGVCFVVSKMLAQRMVQRIQNPEYESVLLMMIQRFNDSMIKRKKIGYGCGCV
jgi:hypothetical protein